MYGKARFTAGQKQAITTPQAAVVERGQLMGVYVVDGGAACLRLIKTGKTADVRVEVLSGLNEGESLVVEGVANLTDDSRVQQGNEVIS